MPEPQAPLPSARHVRLQYGGRTHRDSPQNTVQHSSRIRWDNRSRGSTTKHRASTHRRVPGLDPLLLIGRLDIYKGRFFRVTIHCSAESMSPLCVSIWDANLSVLVEKGWEDNSRQAGVLHGRHISDQSLDGRCTPKLLSAFQNYAFFSVWSSLIDQSYLTHINRQLWEMVRVALS